MKVLDRSSLDALFAVLRASGYTLVGPKVADQAIVYDEIHSTNDLPIGWTDRQAPGSYRLERRADHALFGYVVGPHSWKKYLFPSQERLFRVTRNGRELTSIPEAADPGKLAFIGVRACELRAMEIQDKVFLGGPFADPRYRTRRENAFVVALNCAQAGATCFCVSMRTGPEVKTGFDLALTELLSGNQHEFVVEIGSDRGERVLRAVPSRESTPEHETLRAAAIDQARRQMGRTLETAGLKELLYRNHQHPLWDDLAQRCLSCANCTLVCPTCFCSTVEDVTDLSGDHAERWRKWDSCFTMDFSYLAGGSVRASTKARYRQWMTHKLATWQDQFATSGCVGCGRCITWCPVGIDLTQEAAAIRDTDMARSAGTAAKEKQHART